MFNNIHIISASVITKIPGVNKWLINIFFNLIIKKDILCKRKRGCLKRNKTVKAVMQCIVLN
ncbi:MAG: hypothetical protein D6830_06640 [Ignavibacteria bacterium]|nr:MAG: hypothetical protein D6830_06640 [Ignavibacteria bacterium]